MRLTRIESVPDGSDLRTFECAKCEHIHKVLAEDPMKSTRGAVAEQQPQSADVAQPCNIGSAGLS